MGTVVVVVLALALLATYVTWTASRLDRLHARTDGARTALEVQLARRTASALEAAGSQHLDALADAASAAHHALPADRAPRESALTVAVRAAVPVLAPEQAGDLLEAGRRLALARRFYNDAVRDTQAFRRRRLVRVLRLAGHAPEPEFFDIDDAVPVPGDTPPHPDGRGTSEVVA